MPTNKQKHAVKVKKKQMFGTLTVSQRQRAKGQPTVLLVVTLQKDNQVSIDLDSHDLT